MMIQIPTQFGNNIHCKYIFNVDTTNSVLLLAEHEVFQNYNDSAYIYDKLCPNNFIFDFLKNRNFLCLRNYSIEEYEIYN